MERYRQTEVFWIENNQDDQGLWNHIFWAITKIFKGISTRRDKTLVARITVFKYVESYYGEQD